MFRSVTIHYTSKTPARTIYDIKNTLRRNNIRFDDIFYIDNDIRMDDTISQMVESAKQSVASVDDLPPSKQDLKDVVLPFSDVLVLFKSVNSDEIFYKLGKDRIVEFINSFSV